jgi:hypothetical protein
LGRSEQDVAELHLREVDGVGACAVCSLADEDELDYLSLFNKKA